MQIVIVFDAEKGENYYTAERLGKHIRTSLDKKWIIPDVHPGKTIVIVKEKTEME